MKKLMCIISLTTVLAACPLFANPFDEFSDRVSNVTAAVAQKNLDNFAGGLGILMGGNSFHQGKVLGVPGFDIGIHVPIMNVSDDNAIVKAADLDMIFLPCLQAEIGLPAKFDLIGRFSSYADSTMIGAGLRYGILKGTLTGLPSISAQAVYTTLEVKADENRFTANNTAVAVVASFDLPVLVPYIGVTYRQTTVDPGASIVLPQAGLSGAASGYGIEGGVTISLMPMTYLQLGGMLNDGALGYAVSFGAKF